MITKKFLEGDEVEVTFGVDIEADVEGVSLLCEATDWEPIPMEKAEDGGWSVQVRLPADQEIQYRYLASGGIWLNDDAADAYVDGGHGSDNCVVDTHRP